MFTDMPLYIFALTVALAVMGYKLLCAKDRIKVLERKIKHYDFKKQVYEKYTSEDYPRLHIFEERENSGSDKDFDIKP